MDSSLTSECYAVCRESILKLGRKKTVKLESNAILIVFSPRHWLLLISFSIFWLH